MTPERARLLELVEIADLSRTEIAREAGCSIAYVAQQAAGTRNVSRRVLQAAERCAMRKAGALLVRLATRIVATA